MHALAWVALWAASAQETLALLPGDFTLHGPAARQTLLVERVRDGRFVGPAADATFATGDPRVVVVEGGAAVPAGNGTTTITARADGRETSAKVTVVGFEAPFERSFRNHVQPVLARYGCSSGACHGAAAGKNGFKLSLRGYDDEGDFRAITRHAQGRRIAPAAPERSLLLLKPTATVPHKGGERFTPSSRPYRVLAEWLAAGAPGPRADDPRIVRIELLPSRVVLEPGVEQPLLVRAHFNDGSIHDATPWAKYTGSDSSVAVPDEHGRVRVMGAGEGAITAWYLSKIAVATVTVPYPNAVAPETFAAAPRANFIDETILEKLRDLNLPPSPPCADAEFLRRAFLDTIGTLPTADEARAFLEDGAVDKRERLIDALLSRPEFVDYWTTKWSDLLLVSGRRLPRQTMMAYHAWIRRQVAADAPWDQIVRRIVTAGGGAIDNGAASFFLIHDDPRDMAETISQAFMGMSIQCAKCHNHPMEKWTNDQYYGMANLLARVRLKNSPRGGNVVVFSAPEGELIQPLTGRPQPPRPLDAEPMAPDDPRDRREVLADWLVSPKNAYFARAIVNRVWANFMGAGLVMAVDDMRQTNPPSNEKLLAALADFLVERKFDLKALMREILRSQAYQRSGSALAANAADRRFYSHYMPRRLMAEVALDAISQVTEVPTPFAGIDDDGRRGFEYPAGLRALQLPDSRIGSYFLKSFGRAERAITCECERSAEPSMAQVLHLANGETVQQKLGAPDNRIGRLLKASASDATIVEELFLSALSRFPTPEEKEGILAVVSQAGPDGRREALEDAAWALLSSREFLFNH